MTLGHTSHQLPGIPGRVGSSQGEAFAENDLVMKHVRRVTDYGAQGNLNFSNRPVRTRMPGGVAGAGPNGLPLCRCAPSMGALLRVKVPPQVDHDE